MRGSRADSARGISIATRRRRLRDSAIPRWLEPSLRSTAPVRSLSHTSPTPARRLPHRREHLFRFLHRGPPSLFRRWNICNRLGTRGDLITKQLQELRGKRLNFTQPQIVRLSARAGTDRPRNRRSIVDTAACGLIRDAAHRRFAGNFSPFWWRRRLRRRSDQHFSIKVDPAEVLTGVDHLGLGGSPIICA
jgi:hypothetical protein